MNRTLPLYALVAAALFCTAHADAAMIRLSADTGKCMHKKNSNWDNGNPVHLWDCTAGSDANKTFYYEESTGYLRFQENTSKCLHKKYGNWDNGNPIHLWDCSAGSAANKSWDIDESTGQIRARYNSGKCLHKKGSPGNTDNGTLIHLWGCGASPSDNEKWSMGGTASLDTSVADECTGGSPMPAEVFDDSGTYGNSTVGASHFLVAGIADKDLILHPLPPQSPEWLQMNAELPEDFVWIGGRAEVDATLFGDEMSILATEAAATQEDGDLDSTVNLEVLGVTLIDESIGLSYGWSTDVTFFEASGTFYGVVVTGEMVGTLGFDASADIGATGVALVGTPYVDVTAGASAGVGAWCLSAGAGADLNIISVEVPIEGQMMLVGDDIAWSIDANVEMSTLDGSVYLYIDYCLDSAEYEIFSWDGISLPTIELASLSGCI